ncbi:hypothetical protein [Vibrio inusitatus]|nr:hypothetical protein [Vibrio inusitatus]
MKNIILLSLSTVMFGCAMSSPSSIEEEKTVRLCQQFHQELGAHSQHELSMELTNRGINPDGRACIDAADKALKYDESREDTVFAWSGD